MYVNSMDDDEYEYVFRNILPYSEFRHKIIKKTFKSPEEFFCDLRVNLKDEENFQKWLKLFEEKTKTSWIVRSSKAPEKSSFLYSRDYVCHHSAFKKSIKEVTSKNKFCPASLKVRIKYDTKFTRCRDANVKEGLLAIIKISFHHSHLLNTAEAWQWLKPHEKTRELFLEYFNNGMRPSEAIAYHNDLIALNGPEKCADASINPKHHHIYYLHNQWRADNYASAKKDKCFSLIKMGTEIIPKTEEAVPAEAPSEIERQIIRQIEYYFGNYNLSRDKFLKQQLNVDDGWVPLETLITFNRLKKLSEDFNVIIEALKKSTSNLMEISEDSTKIRRRDPPLLEEYSKRSAELDKQTLYVKGFKKNNTMDELLEFFKEHKVQNVFMRRHNHQNNRPFKGSVFVTFETKEDAEKFIETKGIKFKGTELLKEWKVDYVKRKDEEYEQVKVEKEKKLLKRAGMLKDEKENGEKAPEINIVTGCLLKLTNLDVNTTREQIKAVFEPHGNIVYVDYSKGKPLAVLRFDTGIASSVFEKLTEEDGEKKVEIGSCKAVVSLIEGDEEQEYWKSIAIARAQNRQRMKEFKAQRNSGNKGRFKKWGNKRQRGKEGDGEKDNESSERPQKKIKIEDPDVKDESVGMETISEAPEVKKEIPEVKVEAPADC